ncbi:MAG: hypothetical protein OEZ20_10540 [candidate division WOR-3 bacterium]|nr:hypothetical protein [candidate division WOR-3 bacterium]
MLIIRKKWENNKKLILGIVYTHKASAYAAVNFSTQASFVNSGIATR